MSSDFVHLHAHSEYSLDIGFFDANDYVKFCYENKHYVVALTERFNLFSVIKFYKKCFEFGTKPIIGCEFFLEHDIERQSKFLLLCQNIVGYGNLVKLLTKAYSENLVDGIPVVKKQWLVPLSEGLIAIGLSFESDIGIFLMSGDYLQASNCFKFWHKAFPKRYYLSVTKFDFPAEVFFTDILFDFLDSHKIFLVATNEVCFLRPSDFLSYKSKVAILDLNKRIVLDTYDSYFKNRYFKPYYEMSELFSDMPELIYNSVEISKRCNLIFNFSSDYSPKYLKSGSLTSAQSLVKIAVEKLLVRLLIMNMKIWRIYVSRLYRELTVINSVGFANYFLVTYDFIDWAKCNDVFVGPGRGSGAGSLVAYLLSITEIDPIKYDLLFERFLNIERLSIPDFDVDFCIEGRDLVIDYIFDEYGIKNVAQIVTFGCMTVKAVIRDIGRVLGYSYGFVDRIVKLVSSDFGLSLKSELINNLKLKDEYDFSLDVQTIIDLSMKLEGIIKGVGKHAGGLVISSIDIFGYLPLSYEDEEFNFVTQLDKFDAEALGFIKFDFLGLKTLSIISTVMEGLSSYNDFGEEFDLDFDFLNLRDERTYFLLQSGDTTGIFQLESVGLKSVVQVMRPNLFADIVALVALYRPGPLQSGMLQSFIKRKLGFEEINYADFRLAAVLEETYGMLIYQEQVMLLAQVFSNYTLARADLLRVAMSKKDTKTMNVHLENFIRGASFNNISRETAIEVFFLIEKFAGYGFNKAHSVGYALLAYNSAWFKANYNTFFMLALLSSDMDNYDNVSLYLKESEHFSIKVVGPDINRSFFCFTLFNERYVYYGFGAIKGLGTIVISEIIHNRSVFGPYVSFFNFIYRVDVSLFSKKTMQLLVYSGVFDKLDDLRFKLVLISGKVFDLYFKLESISSYLSVSFIDDYFNYMIKNFSYLIEYKQNEVRQERDLLCDYVSVDPLMIYKSDSLLIADLSFTSGKYFNEMFLGIILNINFKNADYDRQVILSVKSLFKEYNIILSYVRYKSLKNIIKKYSFVVICSYLYYEFFYELFIEDFYSFRYKFVKYLDLVFYNSFISEKFLRYFFSSLSKKIVLGNTYIRIKCRFNGKYKHIFLSENKIALHDDLINNINQFKEIEKIELFYNFC